MKNDGLEYIPRSESFSSTIEELINNAAKNNIEITDEMIYKTLNISKPAYYTYCERDSAPQEIFVKLREAFGQFIDFTNHQNGIV